MPPLAHRFLNNRTPQCEQDEDVSVVESSHAAVKVDNVPVEPLEVRKFF